MRRDRAPSVRDVDSGVTAPLHASDLRHAAREVERVLAEHSGEELVHVQVETLRRYREAVRLELLGELEESGRLTPARAA